MSEYTRSCVCCRYVLVLRCISYPFNAKQPTDLLRRLPKLTRVQLQGIRERFNTFLAGELSIVSDEAFHNAVLSYVEVFLKSDRLSAFVKQGGCTLHDLREVFRTNVERRLRALPEIDGLSRDTVLASWMNKFDIILRGGPHGALDDLALDGGLAHGGADGAGPAAAAAASGAFPQDRRRPRPPPAASLAALASESIMSREQLFDMFQAILGVKKYEHQILYNQLQVRTRSTLHNASLYTY